MSTCNKFILCSGFGICFSAQIFVFVHKMKDTSELWLAGLVSVLCQIFVLGLEQIRILCLYWVCADISVGPCTHQTFVFVLNAIQTFLSDLVHIRPLCLYWVQFKPLCWILYTSNLCVCNVCNSYLCVWSCTHQFFVSVLSTVQTLCLILYASGLWACIVYWSDLCPGSCIHQSFPSVLCTLQTFCLH